MSAENPTIHLSPLQKFIVRVTYRFGAMTTGTIVDLSNKRWTHCGVAHAVQVLRKKGYIQRESGTDSKRSVFAIAVNADLKSLGLPEKRLKQPHPKAKDHCFDVALLLGKLSRCQNVHEVHSESEYRQENILRAYLNRTPDGIILVRASSHSKLVCVEYERAKKSTPNVSEVLQAYGDCFRIGNDIDHVLIVIESKRTLERYRKQLAYWSDDQRAMVTILGSDEVDQGIQRCFGHFTHDPIHALENLDNICWRIAREKRVKSALSFISRKSQSTNTPDKEGLGHEMESHEITQ